MFIVTRTFRDRSGVYSAGTVVEPAEVFTFKSRFHQKHIVDVTEQNFDFWHNFFINRYGIDITNTLQDIVDDTDTSVEETPIPESPAENPQSADLGW